MNHISNMPLQDVFSEMSLVQIVRCAMRTRDGGKNVEKVVAFPLLFPRYCWPSDIYLLLGLHIRAGIDILKLRFFFKGISSLSIAFSLSLSLSLVKIKSFKHFE